jgi:CheY-like chemotaxis protein
MSAEVRRHIFEPFFTTKEQGKGTGLGLAVVHGIVKQSDGHIEVESKPGVGTSFKIYLPSVEQHARVAVSGLSSPRVQRGAETILLVEDEEGVRSLSRTILQRYGYSVLIANHPNDAIRLSQSHAHPIHLLVTDVVMPQMNGLRLAEILQVARPNMKVLYISGYTDETIIGQGIFDSGVFLQKPFSPAALGAKIRDVLDELPRTPAAAWPPLSVFDGAMGGTAVEPIV